MSIRKIKKRNNEQLKRMVRELLDKTPGMDQLDLAQALHTDLKLMCGICDELVKEGKIEVTKKGRQCF